MPNFRIYYGDGSVVKGSIKATWAVAPDIGVQVVVDMDTLSHQWSYKDKEGQVTSVRDRSLWTGQDFYDPFGWGEKEGTLVEDKVYWAIWKGACTDGNS